MSQPYDKMFEDLELSITQWKGIYMKLKNIILPIIILEGSRVCIIDVIELVWSEVVSYVPSIK